MQQNILTDEAAKDLKVYVVWFSMLAGDARSEWPDDVLADARVTHLWDEERAAGKWLADNDNSGLDYDGPIFWDAYIVFDRAATWDNELPTFEGTGWPVIGETDNLKRELEQVLAPA